jgi:hypothetical protein
MRQCIILLSVVAIRIVSGALVARILIERS